MRTEKVSISEARRIALAAQGFDRRRPQGVVTGAQVARTIRKLGLLQIDTVNVLARAHYMVLFSRLGQYPMRLLDELVYRGGAFTEQWAHEASIVPVETWPLLRHRMERHRVRPYGFESFLERHAAYAEWVLEEVRTRGPLAADDLPLPDGVSRKIPGAWVSSVQRAVLEAHLGCGRLAVAERRPNFARAYDLAERVIPAAHYGRQPDRAEAQRELLAQAARAQGIATAADLADYYRMPVREARPRIVELVDCGELVEVAVEGWREVAYLDRQASCPRHIERAALLCPFDPLVWYRPRVARLFGFDYRVEIFVPRAKRRWGYYVLPFLLSEKLVARLDLKADRETDRLMVLSVWLESKSHRDEVSVALAAELRVLARWLGLKAVDIRIKDHFGTRLAEAVES